MPKKRRRIPNVFVEIMLLAALISLVVVVRQDRQQRPYPPLVIDKRTIRLPVLEVAPAGGGSRPPLPADIPNAAAELQRAAEAANEARVGLERTKRRLEHLKQDLEGSRKKLDAVRADANARQKAAQQELAEAQQKLEIKRAEMEKAARDAEQRLVKARQDLEVLEQQRLAAGAQAGIAGGLGQGSTLEMQMRVDPRRVRNPALPRFAPNDAAVAAAGPRTAGGRGEADEKARVPGRLFSSTAHGDMLQGQAALVEAQGSYVLDSSKAAINAQTARAMSLDNHLRTAETFFEARRINRINRDYEAGPRASFDQIVRMAAAGSPPRPTNLQLDPATGDISWPRLLRDPIYASYTSRIQRHFHNRSARGGSFDFTEAEDCDAAFAELVGRMRDNVHRYPGGEYGAARTFVDGLKREYDLPLED